MIRALRYPYSTPNVQKTVVNRFAQKRNISTSLSQRYDIYHIKASSLLPISNIKLNSKFFATRVKKEKDGDKSLPLPEGLSAHEQKELEQQARDAFAKIWGASTSNINKWIKLGYRKLEDLRQNAALTAQQQVGLKYYDEFDMRIPREEVKQIEDTVRKSIAEIDKDISVDVCGSYRRGKPDSADIDIIVSHPNVSVSGDFSLAHLLQKVVDKLHSTTLLTDNLTLGDRSYMGVCQLPASSDGTPSLHRRIDIKAYTHEELPFGILYFTGSKDFNKSIRLHANRKRYKLNDQYVCRVSVSGAEGERVPAKTEEDIFKILGLDYIAPADRDFTSIQALGF